MKGMKAIMKQLLIILVLLSMSAFAVEMSVGPGNPAGNGPVSIGSIAYSQTWDVDEAFHGISVYAAGDRWLCDDFILGGNFEIDEIVVWLIYPDTLTVPATEMNLMILEDVGDVDPNTASLVYDGVLVPSVSIDTGDIYHSESSGIDYNVWETTSTLVPGSYPSLSTGVTYWLCVQAYVEDNCFTMVSVNYIGSNCWFNDGSGLYIDTAEHPSLMYDTDMFFDLYGTEASLESSTWARIKTDF